MLGTGRKRSQEHTELLGGLRPGCWTLDNSRSPFESKLTSYTRVDSRLPEVVNRVDNCKTIAAVSPDRGT